MDDMQRTKQQNTVSAFHIMLRLTQFCRQLCRHVGISIDVSQLFQHTGDECLDDTKPLWRKDILVFCLHMGVVFIHFRHWFALHIVDDTCRQEGYLVVQSREYQCPINRLSYLLHPFLEFFYVVDPHVITTALLLNLLYFFRLTGKK